MKTKKTIFKISFCLLIATCLCSCVSLKPITQTKFEKVIEVPNVSKTDLYIKVNEWFVKNFISAKSVIQFQDKEEGKIIGKYVTRLPDIYAGINYSYESTQTISVDVRDNRIRLTITDPCVSQGTTTTYGISWGSCEKSASDKSQLAMSVKWENLAHSLEEYVNNSSSW